jgi:hypothetical protein
MAMDLFEAAYWLMAMVFDASEHGDGKGDQPTLSRDRA